MVFYRKYRPQIIDDLDSQEIRNKLYAILSSESISHAFLFTGPKGLGKTSTARIIAKVLNCERRSKSQSIEPCNKCDQCVSIANGNNIDVLEIDGASNRGIDEIRDLREKIKLSPAWAAKKVYIIDEVHMLTTEAFNALLKTLEEPPSHVVFILCTTEPHKVPATIASRCLHIAFKKANNDELMRSFKRVAKEENMKIDDDALSLIASFSDGSFRDGVKILEEMVLLFKNKKITAEMMEQKYKISNIRSQISQMIELLERRDVKACLNLVSKLVEQGIDMKYFIEQMINDLHLVLLAKLGVGKNLESPSFKVGRVQNNLELEIVGIKNLIEFLGKAHAEIKYAVLSQLPLELAIIEWGMQEKAQKNAEINAEANIKKLIQQSPASDSVKLRIKPQGKNEDLDGAAKLWKNIINGVNTWNHSIAGVLRGCTLKSFDGKKAVIEAKFKFHKEKLSDKKAQELIENAFEQISGNKVKVVVSMKPA